MPTYKLNSRVYAPAPHTAPYSAHRILAVALDRKPISNLRPALIAQARAIRLMEDFMCCLLTRLSYTYADIPDVGGKLSQFRGSRLGWRSWCVYSLACILIRTGTLINIFSAIRLESWIIALFAYCIFTLITLMNELQDLIEFNLCK